MFYSNSIGDTSSNRWQRCFPTNQLLVFCGCIIISASQTVTSLRLRSEVKEPMSQLFWLLGFLWTKSTFPGSSAYIAPEHRQGPKRKLSIPTSIFRGRTVSFREVKTVIPYTVNEELFVCFPFERGISEDKNAIVFWLCQELLVQKSCRHITWGCYFTCTSIFLIGLESSLSEQ